MAEQTFQTIVVGSDGSAGAAKAVAWTAALAAQAGCTVVLVHAFEPLAELEHEPGVDFATIRDRRLAEMTDAWAAPLADGSVAHRTVLVEDRPIDALVATAREQAADLVVIGSHGRSGWRDRVFGSVATGLPAKLDCAVAIVPTDQHG